ncbi:hypothetical protein ACFL5Z_04425 [Planctomycetota bacterium]
MNRRDLIKKGIGFGVAATGILGALSSKSRASTAVAELGALVDQVAELNAKEGIINSLDAKLHSAVQAIEDVNENNNVAAINSMEAFINAVEAQRDKQISVDDADDLIAAADHVIVLLSPCPGCGGTPCVPPCGGSVGL